jgi:N-methylhydantoinase B/oxoprolinase/acetone carboxylase alpha subunit
MQTNPGLLKVFKNRFSSIAEEMGVPLTHTAFSPNIKERRDLSCAVFDADGDMIAQAAHIPAHLGSMPLSTSLFQEGLIIPPVRIVRGGEVDRELMRLILNNVRTPAEREGDFSAQFMANVTGARRMAECIANRAWRLAPATPARSWTTRSASPAGPWPPSRTGPTPSRTSWKTTARGSAT